MECWPLPACPLFLSHCLGTVVGDTSEVRLSQGHLFTTQRSCKKRFLLPFSRCSQSSDQAMFSFVLSHSDTSRRSRTGPPFGLCNRLNMFQACVPDSNTTFRYRGGPDLRSLPKREADGVGNRRINNIG